MISEIFFLYFVLPAITIFSIFTSKYYYSKKESQKMRFNIPEGLFIGNVVAPLIGLAIILGIYSAILKIQDISQLKWEMLAVFTIAILSLIIGLGIGAHIVAIIIEKSLENKKSLPENTKRILYYFHWPFGHKMTFVPTALIFHVLTLLDLFKGEIFIMKAHQIVFASIFATILGGVMTAIFIVTHVTRTMFYTLLVISASIQLLLINENVTLRHHVISFFFYVTNFATFIFLATYRYSYKTFPKVHAFLQKKFPNGDKVGGD